MRHCIACGEKLPESSLFELNCAPASAQDIPDETEVKTDRGVTLELCQCGHCGLVQFDCEPVSYYKDVIRAGGFSTTMTGLRRSQYQHLIETYHLEGKKFIEVGCGRGEFLNVLTEFPVKVFGMEHKAELVELARQQGLNVWREFPDMADQAFAEGRNGKFDVFLSFNFLEHQPHPEVMLEAIYHNLAEDGMGLVTVPSLEYILEKGSYYELIRDHIAYYSFETLRGLLERNGFAVLEEEMVNRDTLSLIVKKKPKRMASGDEALMTKGISVQPLLDGYEITSGEIASLLEELRREKRTLAIWGASHQGFTLAATTQLKDHVEYIIDSAPFKQGRFAPASHIPILSPDDAQKRPVGAILIVAPGYTDEIAGIIRERFGSEVDIRTLRTNRIEKLDLVGKRVVMTGATGFIGRNVARQLLDRGAAVYALVRPESKQRDLLPVHTNMHLLLGAMSDIEARAELVGHADCFLHFAWGGVNRAEIDSACVQAANVSDSLACVRAAHSLGCQVFMDAGSRVEYGITADGRMEETMECHPVNAYGAAKLEFYQKASELCRRYEMEYYHLRFFSVYGTGDHPWSIISTLTRELPLGKKVSLSACRHKWNFMDIEDAARAVVELYRCSGGGPANHIVNIASTDTRVLKEFTEEIHDLCGCLGELEYGTFVQAKEGALSICPETRQLLLLTGGTWRERVTFSEGIQRMLGSNPEML